MAEDFCRKAMPAYQRLVADQASADAHLLDICCGSGQFAREFQKLGFFVTGLDSSPEMIHLARMLAPDANFFVADARSFSLPRYFGGAVSAFNSLAHLPDRDDLTAVFHNVKKALRPGACFCFDLSTEAAYLSRWHGEFSIRIDGALFTVKPTYDPAGRVARNDILLRDGNSTPQRSVTIVQYCHSEDTIRSAAHTAGFLSIESYDAEEDLALRGERGHKFFRVR